MAKDLSKLQLQFIAVLKKEIEIISNEVTDLLHKDDVYQTRMKPLAGKIDNYAYQQAIKNHFESALIAIRRQLGMDKSEISLKKLLTKLSHNNTWITEEWYTSEWLKESSLIKNNDKLLANFIRGIPVGEFQEYFGKNGYLDKTNVDTDLSKLEEATNKIKQFVDERLAHTDKNKQQLHLNDHDYTQALKIIEQTTSKYILLINQVGMSSLTPVIQD